MPFLPISSPNKCQFFAKIQIFFIIFSVKSDWTKPLRPVPGQQARYDYEYERNGVANLFMMFEPLVGKRHVKVTNRRTKKDWAECVRQLVDEIYPQADSIVLVMDNLNTHKKALLYEAF